MFVTDLWLDNDMTNTATITPAITHSFEVGKTYSTRSACDWDCVFSFEVVSRTAKFITIRSSMFAVGGNTSGTARVGVYSFPWDGINAEHAKPLGSYSMCPVISADRLG